jgi:hypothetical protein
MSLQLSGQPLSLPRSLSRYHAYSAPSPEAVSARHARALSGMAARDHLVTLFLSTDALTAMGNRAHYNYCPCALEKIIKE